MQEDLFGSETSGATTLASVREAAARCTACDLYEHATQTVFGEGPPRARLMFVGEQPGDREDLEGRPFVGPAGQLLRESLTRAGIVAADAYITNAVKHFKFIERGKRRIHATPKIIEIRACEPWLEAEIAQVKPELVVALGATAARVLLGNTFRLTQHRREIHSSRYAPRVTATVHPSSILRADDADRAAQTAEFVEDLRYIAASLIR